jgi:hypothetical protein
VAKIGISVMGAAGALVAAGVGVFWITRQKSAAPISGGPILPILSPPASGVPVPHPTLPPSNPPVLTAPPILPQPMPPIPGVSPALSDALARLGVTQPGQWYSTAGMFYRVGDTRSYSYEAYKDITDPTWRQKAAAEAAVQTSMGKVLVDDGHGNRYWIDKRQAQPDAGGVMRPLPGVDPSALPPHFSGWHFGQYYLDGAAVSEAQYQASQRSKQDDLNKAARKTAYQNAQRELADLVARMRAGGSPNYSVGDYLREHSTSSLADTITRGQQEFG